MKGGHDPRDRHQNNGHVGNGGKDTQTHPHTHAHPPHPQSSMMLWMLLDGVGLGLIAGCTVLEGLDLWGDFFREHYPDNHGSMAFWLAGRSCQVMGLLFLMAHAASFQVLPQVEVSGMMMLTAGPILNICACSLFATSQGSDPYYLFNRQWLLTESIELLGISILDLSLLDAQHYLILSAEVLGFTVLAMAAMLQFDFTSGVSLPDVELRLDNIHLFDCLGLLCLTGVAVVQYLIKKNKHHQQLAVPCHPHNDEKTLLDKL